MWIRETRQTDIYMDTVSSITEDGHQAIYSSLPQLPDPPQDLPKPWDFRIWRSWFVFGFFISLFSFWFLGRLLDIRYLNLGGACVSSWGIFLFLGIILITRFSNRGFRENYSPYTNQALGRAIKKYRKRKPREAYFSLFPRYIIENQEYFLVWYIPGTGSPSTRNLAKGAEPLLFNKEGNPLNDPELFSKVLLMWSYGLYISPGTMQYKLIKDRNQLKKLGDQYLPPLPGLLNINSSLIEDIGLSAELQSVKTNFSAKYALFLHSVDILEKKIAWADSHGWDSLTQLRYKDFKTYHAANVEVIQSRKHLMNEYQLVDSEVAATRLIKGIQLNPREWLNKKQLTESLEVFSAPLPTGEIYMKKGIHDTWNPPEEMLEAYRSRFAFASQVDEKENINRE